MSGEPGAVARRLRLEWGIVAAVALAVLALGLRFFDEVATATGGPGWLAVAGAVLAYEVGFLWYHLDRNRTVSGRIRASLGLANAVTLLRGVLYAVVAGFVLVPPTGPVVQWVPGICYGAGAALDFVDGYVARRAGLETVLGGKLDHAFDTLGFLVAPLVGVAWGQLPVWYLALSAARYCFRAGRAWRRWRGRSVFPLPESRLRRRLAAGQMAFIAAALLPVTPAAVVFPAATVALAASLAVFGRDWLAVSGRLSREQ
ncbi:CDP-alcohol phosphatidyltransferase family protein [Halobacteriales archaeon QS_1_68_17]|nr:MAG: CDP-alcohol phosphatidyltransferase family protein [Halobacteriales archaeon QS_1_68_17]